MPQRLSLKLLADHIDSGSALWAQSCIRGYGLPWDVLEMLASGMTEREILKDYPYLEKADFPAVYAYASAADDRFLSA